jgi:tRNA(Ile)-lysidine synthase
MTPLGAAEFARLMAPLGPFGRRPSLAVAVSGGADSLALALLADHWARARGGGILGLVVDHRLRPASAAEAVVTRDRLARRGIAARILVLDGLAPGPALAARARAARYATLESSCAAAGIVDLLLGHHAADQAETLALRLLGGSGPDGLAGMPALAEHEHVRLLRPLLSVPPGRLRATLQAAGEGWVEDPSNADPAATRARLRALRRDRDGVGPTTAAAVAAAGARGRTRAMRERAIAALLARRVRMAPEGFATLAPGALAPEALAALLRTLAGADFSPSPAQVAALATRPRAGTLGGVQLLSAGALCPGGWLLVREAAAAAPACAACPGTVWDGRFRLESAAPLPPGAEIAALGAASAGLRRASDLPSAVLRSLPGVRLRGKLAVAPHLGYGDGLMKTVVSVVFRPAHALAAAPFLAAPSRLAGNGGRE